jgi:adenine-specific DNA methylase
LVANLLIEIEIGKMSCFPWFTATLPIDAINAPSAREKSIRHGHPTNLHLLWARRPLAACRLVLFAAIVSRANFDASGTFFQQYLNPIQHEWNRANKYDHCRRVGNKCHSE